MHPMYMDIFTNTVINTKAITIITVMNMDMNMWIMLLFTQLFPILDMYLCMDPMLSMTMPMDMPMVMT